VALTTAAARAAAAAAALQLFVERFSSAQKAVMQEEKDAAERKQRLARAEAKKAAAEAAKKVGCTVNFDCYVLYLRVLQCLSAAAAMRHAHSSAHLGLHLLSRHLCLLLVRSIKLQPASASASSTPWHAECQALHHANQHHCNDLLLLWLRYT
jgi:N-acyl-D-aspartate/D-glutamate deacylase